MRERAGEKHPGFVERDLHVDHRARIDAVIRAERPQHRIVPPVARAARRGFGQCRPQRFATHTMLEPPLQRAAQRRPAIGRFAAQFVVATRHAVEHEG
jgi:hypothetical protein